MKRDWVDGLRGLLAIVCSPDTEDCSGETPLGRVLRGECRDEWKVIATGGMAVARYQGR